jgi:hypothetical protein
MIYVCGQQNRRELVLGAPGVNGIDYLEVLGDPGCGTQLAVTFLKDPTPLALSGTNVTVTGGTPVTVTSVTAQAPTVVVVGLDKTGDFSAYTLTLVTGPEDPDPPDGVDPMLSSIAFSFKAGCPTPTDCLPAACAPVPPGPPPDINYLAKDYDGFRQVMLDRLAVRAPAWTERHAADLGIALTEALAYAADHLSYAQDAVSTEAYIGTARSRISLRRHAKLVDYTIGEGCNARALVEVRVAAAGDGLDLPAGTRFYPAEPGLPAMVHQDDAAAALDAGPGPVFSSMRDATLYLAHNEINFYTWGDDDCCLPAGATEATLAGNIKTLAAGAMLIFEEVLGPVTGAPEDADPAHRWAVMLCCVSFTDHKQRPLTDPVTGDPVTRVTWGAEDALPFPLCVSTVINETPVAVSVARANIVRASHGVPAPDQQLPAAPLAGRYYPALVGSPLTFAVPDDATSAAAFLTPDSGRAAPVISLTDSESITWSPQSDLLSRTGQDRYFVPEIEDDGTVFLRFGDGQHGMAPAGLSFTASYRTGNGTPGNVGREALGHAVVPDATMPGVITGVRNPLAVTGGTDPESMQHIRQFAPFDFQSQQRCVTEADYGQHAAAISGVSEARGTLRWTGSWYTAYVCVDPVAPPLTAQLSSQITAQMSTLRMMGTDVAVEAAIVVGLRIGLTICVDPAHFAGDVYQALTTVFTGSGGMLNAANFTFGQTVYAGPLIAAAQAVEGVSAVTLTTFTRMDAPWLDGVAQGFITLGRLEIARCDNDPDHLDHGTLTLLMDGGK